MNNLPIEFKKYFWDCDFSNLDLIKNKNFILGRLLLFGDLNAIKYVIKYFNRTEVKDYIAKKGTFVLDTSSFGFWKKIVEYNDLWEK